MDKDFQADQSGACGDRSISNVFIAALDFRPECRAPVVIQLQSLMPKFVFHELWAA